MKMNPPKKYTFYATVVLAVLSLLGFFGVPFLDGIAYWLMLAAYVVLVLGLFIKGF